MTEKSLLLKKMGRRVEEMSGLRFVGMESLFPFDGAEDAGDADHIRREAPADVSGGIINEGDHFIGRDRYLWLRKVVSVPPAAPGLRPIALFDFGRTGGGHNSGFESLLYIDRKPCQGVDSNHPEVLLDDYAGQDIELTFMLWSGLEGGGPKRDQEHVLRTARMGYLHVNANELYYRARAVTETIELLPDTAVEREGLMVATEAALALLDWDGDRFHDSAAPALAALNKGISEIDGGSAVTAVYTGHSHIDVAWLWRLKHTREKAMRSFATVLKLMEEYGEYVFFQSQPQLYKYIKNDCPDLYERIKGRVAEGRWEADGGMWLEADCNIGSGESLARQFLYGIGFFEGEFGVKPTCLWLPDVFGYSWALPQIMKQCSVGTFVTTKISWNQFNTMPNDLFTWRGMDGTEVVTYFVQVPGENSDFAERGSTYNGLINPHSAMGSWAKFKNKELSRETLIPFGYGDGGGGPTRDMLEMRRAMEGIPGLPKVATGRVGDFLSRRHEDIAGTGRPVRVWDGEFYLEYHRGTYTSQGQNKRANRFLENSLLETEALAVLAAERGAAYPRALIADAWETLLRNQFHDIIPGSSINEVYKDSTLEYAQAEEWLNEARNLSLSALTVGDGTGVGFTLFSCASFHRMDPVMIPTEGEGQFLLEGKPLAAQRCDGGYLVAAPLAPFTLTPVAFAGGAAMEMPSPFDIDMPNRRAETPYYLIEWDGNGRLTRVYDRANGREALAEGGFGNRLRVYEDKPLDYDNWDIDVFYEQKHEELATEGAPELAENGSLRAVIRFRYAYRKSRFTQDMILYANSRRIDFVTTADWHESQRLLKAEFDTSVRATKATYDIQYGHIERPNHRNTSWDTARFEVVGHKWGDLSESNYGVSLLNNCKYGYSALGNTITLSLLKSGKYPDTEADMGTHEFTYALLPHAGTVTLGDDVAQGDTIAQAALLNLPVLVVQGQVQNQGHSATAAIITTGTEALVVDAVKLAEDGNGVIVRMHECRGGHQRARLAAGLVTARIAECDILERPTGAVYKPEEWDTCWRPFEIKSFRLIK